MEDIVIKLHDIARETKDKDLSKTIRLFADDISDKIKKERIYGQRS
jgi:hypothetical protein